MARRSRWRIARPNGQRENRIEARYPLNGILGEELGETRADARRRSTIDPIDGTKSYLRGVPLYGAMVAVVEGQRVLAGCLYCPRWTSWWRPHLARAAGGTARDAPCRRSRGWSRRRSSPPTSGLPRRRARGGLEALGRGGGCEPQDWGDCFGYLLVATGRAEGDVGRSAEPVGCRPRSFRSSKRLAACSPIGAADAVLSMEAPSPRTAAGQCHAALTDEPISRNPETTDA